jgi:hypothetical protein
MGGSRDGLTFAFLVKGFHHSLYCYLLVVLTLC